MIKYLFILLFCSIGYGQGIVNNPFVSFGVSCTADANEVLTAADAAADPGCNEAEVLSAGWGGFNNNITTSIVTDSDTGTWAHKFSLATDAQGYETYSFSAAVNDTFTVSFRAKKTAGGDAEVTGWAGCTGGPNRVNITTSYATYSYDITATATTVRLSFYGGVSPTVTGDAIFVDNLSIIHTNP